MGHSECNFVEVKVDFHLGGWGGGGVSLIRDFSFPLLKERGNIQGIWYHSYICWSAGSNSLELPSALKHLPDEPDEDLLAILEHAVANWSSVIAAILSTEKEGKPTTQSMILDCS